MDYSKFDNYSVVMDYAQSIVSGCKIACEENIQVCERFLRDLENPVYDFNPKDAEFVIKIIESTFCHQQGQRPDGTPLRGAPFLLEPFHKFIVYNLLGFYHKGTKFAATKRLLSIFRERISKHRLRLALPGRWDCWNADLAVKCIL